ncbi:dnaJ homolog subfamily C member 27 isoform X2 [Urocitellus parryii]
MEANMPKRKEPGKSLRIKVISMGNAEVGKSCIIKRYCEKRFVSKYLATIGIDYGVTKVQVRDREIKVNIFDMAGHPFFYEVRNEFYKDTQGVMLVYDVGQKDSFDALDAWLAEMKQELGPHGNMDNIVFVVCANKIDCTKHRCVDESEGRLWAESKGFLYFETSAQTGEGINEMFQLIYVKMAENVLPQIAVLVSPKNKQTPFAEFEIVKIVGTCWESNLGPQGKRSTKPTGSSLCFCTPTSVWRLAVKTPSKLW